MTFDIERMRARLRSFDLTGLLVEELGWDHHPGSAVTISANEQHFRAAPIAEKKGFVVWRCEAGDGRIPSHSIRRQIETQITRHAFEHLIVFVDAAQREQVWQWVRRQAGKPDASREYTYRASQTGEPLLQRLRALRFGFDEEEALTISLVAKRVKGALNAEKVTKRFYNHFQEELKNFQCFIEGIEGSTNVDWYASLMLNRLMFIYFIQKRGFLDGDPDYLRNRLERVRAARGPDSFHDFYRIFLRRLFHEGLGRPEGERSPQLTALLGEVPFLNGGIFDVHDLERDNPDIRIRGRGFRAAVRPLRPIRLASGRTAALQGQRDQPGRAGPHLREIDQPEGEGRLLHQGGHHRIHGGEHDHSAVAGHVDHWRRRLQRAGFRECQ